MKQIKIAIIGAGIWGNTHASIYNEHPFAKVVAVCDSNLDKATALAKQYDIKHIYKDYHQMLKEVDCDAVAIVTPDHLHADIAIACANAKKHMLIEKPLATSKEDVLRMVKAFQANDVKVMVDFHNRWSPPFNVAKQTISSGSIGKPINAYFRLNDIKWVATDMLPWAASSSILWFLGSHSLETLRWIIDDEPDMIYAVSRKGLLSNLGVDTEDVFQTTITFKNGTIAQMENGWVTPNGNSCINDIKFNIVCEKGKIDIDASSHNLIQLTTDTTVTTPDILVRNHVFDKCKGFAYESIRSFVDKLASNQPFDVSITDAANTSLAILAIMESAKTKQPIKVKLIDELLNE